MTRRYPILASPLKLRGVTLRNRIISAPMGCPNITSDGHFTRTSVDFYEMRARGGAAAVTASEAIAHMSTGSFHDRDIDPQESYALAPMAEVARGIQRHGALASLEINHGGFVVLGSSKRPRFGPSAMTGPDGLPVQEMDKALIAEITAGFASCAAAAKRAGFDMVLLHAGHGWLINQFLSPAFNRRTDEYGGSTENRVRLLLEILDAMRAAVGEDFPIEVRMTADEYSDEGYDITEAVKIARLIDGKADLIQVSTGSRTGSFYHTHPPMYDPRGCNVHYAAEIKKHVSTPVATIGALDDPEMIEEILESGQADVVEMGRGLLADPFFPQKAVTGREAEITHCIRCFCCMAERGATQTRYCAVNPAIGMERPFIEGFAPAPVKRRVLVAGGGPAGMSAAVGAALRDHSVTLCEASERLGGAVNCERGVDFKQDFYAFAASKRAEMERLGVDIRLSTPVTPELCEKMRPDVLIVALGAEPVRPPLDGIDGGNVVVANDLSEPETKVGNTVAVLGGGLVGCEAALHLAKMGKSVTVAEMSDKAASDANDYLRAALMDELAAEGVALLTGTLATAVTPEGLLVRTAEGEERLLEADTVVCAAGQRPRSAAAEALRDAAPEVVTVGDCARVGNMRGATFSGFFAGLDV